MIIYPIIILALLIAGFVVVWRRAYIVQSTTSIPDEPVKEKPKRTEHKFFDRTGFWGHHEKAESSEPVQPKEAIFKEKEEIVEEPDVEPKPNEEKEDVDVSVPVDPAFAKAEELFKKKQYISAEKWFIEAVKSDTKNPKIYSRLGVIYIEQRNFADAIEALNEAIKLDPSQASRYFNLSFAYNAEGDKKEALNNAKRAIKIDPDNKKYKNWYEELRNSPF